MGEKMHLRGEIVNVIPHCEDGIYHTDAQSHPTLCYPMDCVACQALLSMEFSRQEYWSGFPSPGKYSEPRDQTRSPSLQVDFLPFESPGKPKKARVGSLSLL